MRSKAFLFLTIIFFLGKSALAQSQNSAWGGYFGTFKFKDSKFGLAFDAQLRSSDDYERLQQYLVRPSVSYSFNKTFAAAIGYAYVSNYALINGESDRIDEHRSWEQVTAAHKLWRINLTHRLRLEQRWISSVAAPDDYQTQQRVRYFFRGVLPFNSQPKFEKGFFGAIQEEIMFNYANKEVTNNSFFDQNRAYLALGYRINPKFDVEAGYMNQLVKQRNGSTLTNNIIQLAFYSRLSL